ncbi:ATP-binding protein [Prescottella equi]|uniref:LuxR family transcriptional regulator n=1 Tax=Rhodococcus hoagii TaxID=43767 RepID=A0AAE2W6L0_RHOHA|nr:LuxR C-terminal-related transcriptional regulator [Prescottella equi]MBM4468580.1 LuxR family transcriptional regulator [Prescottella equi]MBM4510965.1 LuxR family transcriptional regulator [Prescottella equi]MBM4540908.1 LuxR family transcriptional regulator [Prescottella equi]MBM4714801.1 LuxR family transcriptional regulator [Prescottella equi]NKS11563.1 LuxR family transcriptional regulator [Prescottella equi]
MAPAVRGKVGNLPLDLTSFVGRRREVAETRRALGASRLVTLTGIGGVGKTRLALRVAADSQRSFADGVWLVEFGERRDPQLVAESVAAALGLREQSAVPTTRVLTDYLASRNLLLVLDNCEHLIDDVAKLAETLLRSSPDLRILATSREPLAIGGEMVLRVPPMTVPIPDESTPLRALAQYEAVNLFAERAAAAVPGFELTDENRNSVVAICTELDGLPLPIELAAARLRAMSVDQVLERLTDRFRLLTGGSRSAPDRQQTLRMSIDWSHDLCNPDERELWRRLSVFTHGFELDAAEAVAAQEHTSHDLLDVVASLVDKSILIREEHPGVVRYRLLDNLREYGLERLHEAGEFPELRRRHRDWYLMLLDRAEAEWIGPDQSSWITRIERERPNLAAALEYCLTEPGEAENGLRIANVLYIFWISRGLLNEGRLWLARVLAAQGGEPTRERVKALAASAILAANQGDVPMGQALVREARDEAARLDDRLAEIIATHAAGHVQIYADDPAEAIRLLDSIVDAVRSGHNILRYISTVLGLATATAVLRRREETARYTDEVLEITRARGESIYRSYALCMRGLAEWHDDPAAARPDFAQAAALSGDVDDLLGTAIAVEVLAWTAAAAGQFERSAILLGAADALWSAAGNPGVVIPALRSNRDEARTLCEGALGARAFDTAVRRGCELTLDEVVDFAVADRLPEAAPTERAASDLTPREQEVAELVAQGLTNKAIAEKLVISQRTVQGHVEHVLAKLGFNSRTQIAAWVVERGHET